MGNINVNRHIVSLSNRQSAVRTILAADLNRLSALIKEDLQIA
jgi:hypothetical protein